MVRTLATTTKPSPVPIMSLGTFDETTNILLTADAGIGKSVFSGTMERGLFLATDPGGTISAKRFGSKADLVICHTWEELDAMVVWLREGGYRKYKWVALDSISFAQELLWDFIMRRVVERNSARNRFVPDKGEYFNNYLAIKHLATTMVNLPVNTIMTAWPQHLETQDGDDQVLPLIIGQKGAIAQYVMGLMSCYGYMRKVRRKDGKTVRRIYWEQKGPYLAKDRYGVLAPYTDDITIPEIERRIKAVGKPETGRPTRRPATRRRAHSA